MKKLGLYIHIPFCNKERCSYCDFTSYTCYNADTQKQYIATLIKEASEVATALDPSEIDTVFIGGGTPSTLYSDAIPYLMDGLSKHLSLNIKEFTVEMNPESVTHEFVRGCVSAGVNRVSLGLQTTNDTLLKNLRKHTYNDFLTALGTIKAHNITNINADLMLGLPGQTLNDIGDALRDLSGLGLTHLSAYGLKVEERTRLYNSGFRADDDFIADCYNAFNQQLSTLFPNFYRYEVSNFALRDYECRHNFKYWRMDEYVGLGVSASSYYGGKRITNTADLDAYLRGTRAEYTEESEQNYLTELIMLGLRTSAGVEIARISNEFMHKGDVLKYINDGVLIVDNGFLRLNNNYFYVMNDIISKII